MNSSRSAALALLLSGAVSCGLFVSFDDFDTSTHASAGYVVGGTVDGLEGGTVTVALNGAPTTLTSDGTFVFPGRLQEGEAYVVDADADQPGRACSVERGAGTVGGGDVMDIGIRCGSNIELTSLVLSAGGLSPAFAPRTRTYTAEVALVGVIETMATTVTAVARVKDAKIEIASRPVRSGEPSAPIPLSEGETHIAIKVTAPDGNAEEIYEVRVAASRSTEVPAERVTAPKPGESARFGGSVAISGDTLVVGASDERGDTPSDGGLPPVAGAVYVFRRDGDGAWAQEARLTAANPHEGARFGGSVAISGDTLVVGADGDSSDLTGVHRDRPQKTTGAAGSGAAYVFTRKGRAWSQEAYIKASAPSATAGFGHAVAMSNDALVVGAPGALSTAGAAYVFVRAGETWLQQAQLTASNIDTAGHAGTFGAAVAVAGDTLAVGAPYENGAATGINGDETQLATAYPGAAYVFTRSGTTWTQQAYIKASNTDPHYPVDFGRSIAVSGDTLAVAAPFDISIGSGVDADQSPGGEFRGGAVYVFVRGSGGWSQQAFIKASSPRKDALFGASVSLLGPFLAVGAPGGPRDAPLAAPDGAYLFEREGASWKQRAHLKPPNAQEDANFGVRLALSADRLVVGASGEGVPKQNPPTELVPSAGAVYVYR